MCRNCGSGPAILGLLAEAEEELRDPELWCTSFALSQGCARVT